ncbi:MAG TPA: hypothetical protein DDY12_03465 [Porphyromonadaceae bacterium]|nr:hypothetical protein [Porphyromonadaceae bacterium]
MKKVLFLLVMVLTAVVSARADKYTIKRDALPETAQTMLNVYFPKAKVGMIKVDRHLLKKTDYDVRLVNGTTIEFNNAGKWTSVDCKSREVPEGLVPRAIRNHVSKNYKGVKIVSIRKKSSGYELGLSDGVMLKYGLLGQFKGVKLED